MSARRAAESRSYPGVEPPGLKIISSTPDPTPKSDRRADLTRQTLEPLANLFSPVSCPGCDAPDTPLCKNCQKILRHLPYAVGHLVETGYPDRTWAQSLYQGAARRIVLSAKHSGAEFYQEYLIELGFYLGLGLIKEIEAQGAEPLRVMPCPSQFALRSQQKNPSAVCFAQGLADAMKLVAPSLRVKFAPWLRLKLPAEKQAGKGRAARQQGRKHTMYLSREASVKTGAKPLAKTQVLLVDDVITTGATMREAARVVEENGGKIAGIVALSVVGKISN